MRLMTWWFMTPRGINSLILMKSWRRLNSAMIGRTSKMIRTSKILSSSWRDYNKRVNSNRHNLMKTSDNTIELKYSMRFVSKVYYLFILKNRSEIVQKVWRHSKGVEIIWVCGDSGESRRQDKVQTRDISQTEITRVTKPTSRRWQ